MKQDQILLALVAATDSTSSWVKNMYGWKESPSGDSTIDVCDWTGVDCENSEVVKSINLSNTNLATTIPSELGMLYYLEKLDLSGNIIMGTIPPEVAQLPNLQELRLKDNQLSGSLPMFHSSTLRVLDVENNHLEGKFPNDGYHNCPQLKYFSVCNNGMHGTLPSSLSNMSNLETLCLSSNKFYGVLPSEWGKLEQLKFLYVDNNDLMGIIPPDLVKETSKLEEFWLHHNHFSGTLPPALADMPHLRDFYIDRCKFTGSVPSDLCHDRMNKDFFEEVLDKPSNPAREEEEDISKEEGGNREDHICESIACPMETYSIEGVYPCKPCEDGTVNPYLARTSKCFNNDEEQILQDFYQSTMGNQRRSPKGSNSNSTTTTTTTTTTTNNKNDNIDGWNNWFQEGYTKCDFVGVTCNDDDRVTRIELPSKGLRGTIPETIGFLEHLETLDLSNNELSGFLPPDLIMSSLRQIDVANNNIIGIVPPRLCLTHINNNGHDGKYRCDYIACSEGTYNNIGRAEEDRECLPCNDGIDYLGKTYCSPNNGISSSGSTTSTMTEKEEETAESIGVFIAFMGLFILFIAIMLFFIVPRVSPRVSMMNVRRKYRHHEAVNTSDHHDEGRGGTSDFSLEPKDFSPYMDYDPKVDPVLAAAHSRRVMNIDEYNLEVALDDEENLNDNNLLGNNAEGAQDDDDSYEDDDDDDEDSTDEYEAARKQGVDAAANTDGGGNRTSSIPPSSAFLDMPQGGGKQNTTLPNELPEIM